MLLRRFTSHVREQNWFAVCLDLAVVVLGLFIGLQVDTWWESRKEMRLEGAYLAEIREDFQQNKAQLEGFTARMEGTLESLLVLQEQATLPKVALSVPELNRNFKEVFQMAAFMPVDRAFANLTGSGDLRLISSRSLKNALAEYYSAAREAELVQNTHEMELVEIYEPYAIENLDYSAVAIGRVDDFPLPPPVDEASILKVISTQRFRNILTQKWVISTDLLDQHRGMLRRTNEILKMLDSIEGKGGSAREGS